MHGCAPFTTACPSFWIGATRRSGCKEQPAALLHAPPEDALQEWIVSPRVNRSGVGDDDPTLIEAVELA
jgi:hypothetical protein